VGGVRLHLNHFKVAFYSRSLGSEANASKNLDLPVLTLTDSWRLGDCCVGLALKFKEQKDSTAAVTRMAAYLIVTPSTKMKSDAERCAEYEEFKKIGRFGRKSSLGLVRWDKA
jgi:hypothetical protein